MRLILALAIVMFAAACSSSPPRERDWTGASNSGDAISPAQRDVVRQALGYVGVPYRYGGDSAETGFDCSGLVWRVYRQAAGLRLPRDTYGISREGIAIPPRELKPGDLVFFNTMKRPYSHVGIYVGQDRFVHAPSSGGVVQVTRISDRYWRQRFDGARRMAF
jgi:cell wall-associated NlpC family hydrolase